MKINFLIELLFLYMNFTSKHAFIIKDSAKYTKHYPVKTKQKKRCNPII